MVRYFDIGSPDSKMSDARATSVEITLQPEDSINGCPNRHKVGVCETVKCLHQPSDAPVIWGKIGGGSLRMGNNNDECCYDAPVLGTSASLTATCGEEQYSTFITVIEPAGLWCSNHVTSIISNTAPYTFGGIGMNLHLYVLPFSVSFLTNVFTAFFSPEKEKFRSPTFGVGSWYVCFPSLARRSMTGPPG